MLPIHSSCDFRQGPAASFPVLLQAMGSAVGTGSPPATSHPGTTPQPQGPMTALLGSAPGKQLSCTGISRAFYE